MPGCAVFYCKKTSKLSSVQRDGVSFHVFPKHPYKRQQWTAACNRHPSWLPKRTSTICSTHFEPSHFLERTNNRRRLAHFAVPTLLLDNPKIKPNRENNDVDIDPPHDLAPPTATQSDSELPTEQVANSVPLYHIKIEPKRENNDVDIDPLADTLVVVADDSASVPPTATQSDSELPTGQVANSVPLYQPKIEPKRENNDVDIDPLVDTPVATDSASIPPTATQSDSELPTGQVAHPVSLWQPCESYRNKKLKWQLENKNRQIKRLHSKIRYLEKKVKDLKELINTNSDEELTDND